MIMTYHLKSFSVIIITNLNISVDICPNVIAISLFHHQLKFISHIKIPRFEKNHPFFHYHHINILVHLSNEIIMKVYISLIHIIKNPLKFFPHYRKQKNMNHRLSPVVIIVKINMYQRQIMLIFLHIVCKQR